jgi:uncharacterized SAM-binding protein YcdF (DUF218 family)
MRLVRAALLLVLLSGAMVAASAFWFARSLGGTADAIVVLGASQRPDGSLSPSSRVRVEEGVRQWKAGRAPVVIFSGGLPDPGVVPAARAMADLGLMLGLPPAAIRVEDGSHSTIQNAVLTRRILTAERLSSVVLVSEGFHLMRSCVTFRLLGMTVAGTAAPHAFPPDAVAATLSAAREAAAWPFNLARLAGWHVLGAAGWPEDRRLPLMH